MVITSKTVADKVAAYLRHDVTLAELVDWAENALMVGKVDERNISVISAALASLGVADVRAFGLSWEDSEDLLRKLGYAAHVQIVSV